MSEATLADAVLRQFLLDKVDDDERQRIESLFVTDTSFNERLLALEQDLIDDYFEGSLTKAETESFRRQYACSPVEKRKLAISKSVKDWADSQSRMPVIVSQPGFRLRPVIAVPVVAAMIVAIVLGVLWINARSERDRQLALEQELSRLNSRAASTPVSRSINLSPITIRNVEAQSEIETSGLQILELRLLWIQQEHYPSYRAVLTQTGKDQTFKIGDLTADEANANVIRVKLPVRMLSRGQFRITLSGVTSGGAPGLSDEYSFTLSASAVDDR